MSQNHFEQQTMHQLRAKSTGLGPRQASSNSSSARPQQVSPAPSSATNGRLNVVAAPQSASGLDSSQTRTGGNLATQCANLATPPRSQPHPAYQQVIPRHTSFNYGFHNLVAAATTIAQQQTPSSNESATSLDHLYAAQCHQQVRAAQTSLPSNKYPRISGVEELLLAAKIDSSHSQAAASGQNPLIFHNQYQQHQQQSMPNLQKNTYPVQSYHGGQYPLQHPCDPAYQSVYQNAHIPYPPSGRGLGPFLHTRLVEGTGQIQTVTQNKSELELFCLLDGANLLQYYETFLKYGGDDVKQLSDAGQDEFIEIMKLIGMTDKPLHIRRLQKALCEWREEFDNIHSMNTPFKIPTGATTNLDSKRATYGSHSPDYRQPSQDHARCSSLLTASPAPTPATSDISLPSSALIGSGSIQQQQQYCTPLEVMVGAPKRPRLMDSIKPRDLTKTYQNELPPSPDVRQLVVRKAIIEKRKRAKLSSQQKGSLNTSSQDRGQDPGAGQTQIRENRTKRSPQKHDRDSSTPNSARCSSYSPTSPRCVPSTPTYSPASPKYSSESEHDDDAAGSKRSGSKSDDSIIEVSSDPGKRSSVRVSLLARFNATSDDKPNESVKQVSLAPSKNN